ncbi:MAG TPA: hypothetical protein PKC24_13450 [Cyclobacteriaceae bacterium]|nr:hypothetical protein [Cyclobacteriaceae bacterium]
MQKLGYIILLLQFSFVLVAQEADTVKQERAIEALKYKQQPGLALAASKIFFSDKRYSISGFGEVNLVNYRGPKNTQAGDIELYYTNLYRYANFFGYRFTDKVIWNSEVQIEYLHDGTREGRTEFIIEAFMDFILHDAFKMRAGFFPLTIGYVNNNDEPVMFYSVNRSEVERIIIPSSWIELGVMFYGNISQNLSYALALSQGLNSESYLSGTWIRQGREIRLDVPQSLTFNPQLNFTGIENVTLSTSAYIGNSGQGNIVNSETLKANIQLYTGYAQYEKDNLRFTVVGATGTLSETDRIYQLTLQETGNGQVLGSSVYGYLAELGYDFLPMLRRGKNIGEKKNWFYHSSHMKLPLFLRYERLNTHSSIDNALVNFSRVQNDLTIWTLGANFNPRENIVFKLNYQFRDNKFSNVFVPRESDFIEFGFGFIF